MFSGLNSSQVEVFLAVRDSIEHVLRDWEGSGGAGGPSTIFAYGQTGSGKTYTMFGGYVVPKATRSPSPIRSENEVEGDLSRGIVPRAIKELFRMRDRLLAEEDGEYQTKMMTISCSFLQVYNEKIYDLLAISPGSLPLLLQGGRNASKGKLSSNENMLKEL